MKRANLGWGVLTLVMAVSSVASADYSSSRYSSNYSSSYSSYSSDIPECEDNGRPIPVDNAQVIQWKTSTRNQFHARGHVKGTVGRVYPNRNGHLHFELILGERTGDDVEIVYNESFGATPELRSGMEVEACGDYITSYARAGRYPPSPDGAIIHWVHGAPNPDRHPHGFIVIDGQVYGQDTANAGPRRHRKRRR